MSSDFDDHLPSAHTRTLIALLNEIGQHWRTFTNEKQLTQQEYAWITVLSGLRDLQIGLSQLTSLHPQAPGMVADMRELAARVLKDHAVEVAANFEEANQQAAASILHVVTEMLIALLNTFGEWIAKLDPNGQQTVH